MFKTDLVFVTCTNGHGCRIVSTIHTIGSDGTISPSYVCPVKGCGFHEFVRLLEWEGPRPTHAR